MNDPKEIQVLELVKGNPEISSNEIFRGIASDISISTVKRILAKLVSDKLLMVKGKGKATRYVLSPAYELLHPVELDKYYRKEIDERDIREGFNFSLISETLYASALFTESELNKLEMLQAEFRGNISGLSEPAYQKEMERLAIDLSWKSSQIEGNTYSLLETERLLKEKETASGKTKEEAVMLLNHKEALDFIVANTDYLIPLSVSKIEDIHSILIKELGVERHIRQRRVGISGTNYRPLDNAFQISEALSEMCTLVNSKANIFEKALLLLVLISYIQPFADGNKRTARIVSNAVLINFEYCPISFRTVDSVEYKKAMLVFYEQNNISAFKKIFIDQFEFAVQTYF